MDIVVQVNSAVPIYEQIISQVCRGVESGDLKPGDPLPPIRQLATDLDLTPATVAKAYQLMEQGSIIRTGGRRGTFVHEDAANSIRRFVKDRVESQTREFIREQIRLGIGKQELKSIFTTILESFKGGTHA